MERSSTWKLTPVVQFFRVGIDFGPTWISSAWSQWSDVSPGNVPLQHSPCSQDATIKAVGSVGGGIDYFNFWKRELQRVSLRPTGGKKGSPILWKPEPTTEGSLSIESVSNLFEKLVRLIHEETHLRLHPNDETEYCRRLPHVFEAVSMPNYWSKDIGDVILNLVDRINPPGLGAKPVRLSSAEAFCQCQNIGMPSDGSPLQTLLFQPDMIRTIITLATLSNGNVTEESVYMVQLGDEYFKREVPPNSDVHQCLESIFAMQPAPERPKLVILAGDAPLQALKFLKAQLLSFFADMPKTRKGDLPVYFHHVHGEHSWDAAYGAARVARIRADDPDERKNMSNKDHYPPDSLE